MDDRNVIIVSPAKDTGDLTEADLYQAFAEQVYELPALTKSFDLDHVVFERDFRSPSGRSDWIELKAPDESKLGACQLIALRHPDVRILLGESSSIAEQLASELDLKSTVHRYQEAFHRVHRNLQGYDPFIEQARLCMAAGRPMMLIGETGSAKSLFANSIYSQFAPGANIFSYQLTKTTLPDAIFGPLDLQRFEQGDYWTNTEGYMVRADLVFLDEFANANLPLKLSVLGLLNEGVFQQGKQIEKARTKFTIATGNHFETDASIMPSNDRFLGWSYLGRGFDSFVQMGIDQLYLEHGGKPTSVPLEDRLTMPELERIQLAVRRSGEGAIAVSPWITFLKSMLTEEYLQRVQSAPETDVQQAKAPFPLFSPRRLAWSNDLLKASAVLDDRQGVEVGDLAALRHAYTMVGAPNDLPKFFDEALKRVESQFVSGKNGEINRESVEYLSNVLVQIHEVRDALERGESYDATLGQKIKMWIGLLSPVSAPFDELSQALKLKPPRDRSPHARIQQGLRSYVEKQMHAVIKRLDPEKVKQLIR